MNSPIATAEPGDSGTQGGKGHDENPVYGRNRLLKTPSMYVPGAAHYPRILAYHEISSRFHLGINSISPRRFLSHLDYLKNADIMVKQLRDLSDTSRQDSVCLTFDDGYLSFYDEVFPFLVDRNLSATIFIITGYVGRTNDWEITLGLNRRRHLDWGKLREIAGAGIDVGSHGRTHRDLTRLKAPRRKAELGESKEELEDHLGREITSLALPFGAGSVDVIMTARDCGYREICGGIPNLLKGPLPGILPRMPVYRGDALGALQRKLNMSLFEAARLASIQSCSKGTRILKK